MGFRDFITNRLSRNRLIADADAASAARPPANPSRGHVDFLVGQLLDEQHAWFARRELEQLGRKAAASLVAAVRDARYQQHAEALGTILELLILHDPDAVATAATPLTGSASDAIRKTAAIHLATLGRGDTVPLLGELLTDTDEYVRSYVAMGVQRAVKAGAADPEFRRSMYDRLLTLCDQDWANATSEAAEGVIKLDPGRAAVDFATDRWLTPSNSYAYRILQACNEAGLRLPEERLRVLLEHSRPRATGQDCYPHEYVVAETLKALAREVGERARPDLEAALASDQKEIQVAAAHGLAAITGLDDPVRFVLRQRAAVGYDALTTPQRVVFCAFQFDAEVCNGGITQFFGNSGGAHAADTLDALQALDHAEAVEALSAAMKLIGPVAREADRDLRLSAFEDRYDELQAGFGPLESAYYAANGLLRQRMLLYAVAHADHFRPRP